MLKWIGAVLVMCCTVSIGFASSKKLADRERLLYDITAALGRMRDEIEWNMTQIPKLMELLAHSFPRLDHFFTAVAGDMTAGGRLFGEIWASNIVSLDLRGDERLIMASLSAALGKYDVDAQVRAINYAINRLSPIAKAAADERSQKSRLNKALGLAAGFAAIVIVI